jgi:hypothetical protein
MPRLALRKKNVEMEPRQAAFAAEVEAYPSGLFRGSYSDVGDLLAQVGPALRDIPAATGSLVFAPVTSPVKVGWRTSRGPGPSNRGLGDPEIEVYLTPVDLALRRSKFRVASNAASRLLREVDGVGQSIALDSGIASDDRVTVSVNRPTVPRVSNSDVSGGNVEGLSMRPNGEVCAWATLRRDFFGAVIDEPALVHLATPLVGLAGRFLGEVAGTTEITVVPSVAMTHPERVQVGRPSIVGTRSASTMPMTDRDALSLAGDESAVLSAVVPGAADVARELAAQAIHALESDARRLR